MFHFSEAITDTKGNALIDYYVKAVNQATGEVVNIFLDDSSTPISTASGIENAAKVNADGNAQFYVGDGEYHLDIYATDGATFVRRIEDLPMVKVGLLRAETVAELAALDTGYPAILREVGNKGLFDFDDSDLSIQVAADPDQTTYVAPSSDETGASGAWVRMSGQATQPDSVLTGKVSGCDVAYRELLIFDMSAGTYYLDGIFHSAVQQEITLAAADGTNPRIDVLYLDTEGVLQKLTGTPAASPSKPAVDPSTQLELTFVLVPAAAASLSGVTTTDIYLENTEWTTSQSGTALTLASTNNPYAGTVDIETTGTFGTGNYVNFATTNMAFGGDGNLILRIRSKTAWNAKRLLTVQFWCDGAIVGSAAAIRSGAFGFDSSSISAYQVVIIPKANFAIAAGTEIDALRITCAGSGNSVPSFYMDNVQLQTNGTTIGNSDLTQSIADSRYVNVTGDTMTGDLVVPDEAYDATAWNGSLEVPTKNAVRDKIEALAPGGVISGALLIANNLSDLNSASTARTNMGLGSIATQAANNVAITGGSVTGITDLTVADGGTGASTAAAARTNLGVVIGTDVKAQAPSIQSVASAATVTPTFSDDLVKITAQAAGLTLANWSGTSVPGWGMGIRIKDNGTARAIAYGTNYRAIGVTLPTTTVISKTLYLGCVWNSDDSKIDVIAVAQEA